MMLTAQHIAPASPPTRGGRPERASRGRALLAGALLAFGICAGCGSQGDPSKEPDAPSPERVRDVENMVEVPGGSVTVAGSVVDVAPFLLGMREVTNDEFAAFVEATGYVTYAEEVGNSVVFLYDRGARGEPRVHDVVFGADWRHPLGPDSSIEGKGDHPVIHVSWHDASTYASWRGLRLPSGAEWVHASKGGLDGAKYPWGSELRPGRLYQMNAWQGTYPVEDSGLDGYRGTSPVGSFPPNGYRLFDVAGNVWEWTSEVRAVGSGPEDRVAAVRGGSFLCRERAIPGESACRGYEIGSVQWKPLTDGNHNVGFRCAMDL